MIIIIVTVIATQVNASLFLFVVTVLSPTLTATPTVVFSVSFPTIVVIAVIIFMVASVMTFAPFVTVVPSMLVVVTVD